jgi:hypothetical protein
MHTVAAIVTKLTRELVFTSVQICVDLHRFPSVLPVPQSGSLRLPPLLFSCLSRRHPPHSPFIPLPLFSR